MPEALRCGAGSIPEAGCRELLPPALPPLSLHLIVLTPLEVVVSLLTRCSWDDGAFLAAWGQAVGGGKMGLVGASYRTGGKWDRWGQNAELVGGNQLREMQRGQAMPA